MSGGAALTPNLAALMLFDRHLGLQCYPQW